MFQFESCVFFRGCQINGVDYRYVIVVPPEKITKAWQACKYVKRYFKIRSFLKKTRYQIEGNYYQGKNLGTLESNFRLYHRQSHWNYSQINTVRDLLDLPDVLIIPPAKHTFKKSFKIQIKPKC